MKRIISLLVTCVMLFLLFSAVFLNTSAAETYSGTYNDLTWTLDADTGELVISGEGEMNLLYTFANYRNLIKSVLINEGVTSVGEWVFHNFDKLTSVVIPDSVTSIDDRAFLDCDSLTSIIITDGVTSIGEFAFASCDNLTSVTIGNNVREIENSAFDTCNKLVEVINHSELSMIAGADDLGHITYYAKEIHEGESKIIDKDGYLFYTYDNLSYLIAYKGTETDIVLPQNYNGGVYKIYDYAFYNRDSLISITISDSTTAIGEHAFEGCNGLINVNIPNSVTNIGESAFESCFKLTAVNIPNSINTIEAKVFANCIGLTTVNIPDTVIGIGNYAFCGCNGLSTITIPNSVTSIGDGAFSSCICLSKIVIPDGVTSIGNVAFSHCSFVKSITIPNSVKSFGEAAFWCCKNAENIIYHGTEEQWNNISKGVDWDGHIGVYTENGTYTLVYDPQVIDNDITSNQNSKNDGMSVATTTLVASTVETDGGGCSSNLTLGAGFVILSVGVAVTAVRKKKYLL